MAGIDAFPYTPVPASLKRLLEKIPTIGVPQKADATWLEGLGFGGGNNRMSIALLKQVGIIDSQGKPTELWTALRSKDRQKFGAGVRKHYADLFAMYPDANRKDDEALIAYVRSKTEYAEATQRLAVRTFKVFTDFGAFDASATQDLLAESGNEDEGAVTRSNGNSRRGGRVAADGGVALTVNIQLQLPPSADGEIYDKLFEAMGKHLKGLVSLE